MLRRVEYLKIRPLFHAFYSIAPDQENLTAVYFPEVVCCHGKTKSNDAYAHQRRIHPAHHTSAQVTAKQRASCHHQAVLPIHLSFDKEHYHCNGPEAATQGVLQRKAGVDVSQANQVEGGNYKDANAGPKISARDCDATKQDARTHLRRNGPGCGYFSRSDRTA